MLLPGRHGNSSDYRYGYNGMELDNEIKGTGNSYDFGARMLDPRVGRWLSPDNHEARYPHYSTYSFAINNPNIIIDPDGNDWFYYQGDADDTATWHWHDGTEHQIQTGVDINGEAVYVSLENHASVVIFEGNRDERLGGDNNNNIMGEGATTATVTVYGPGGPDDIETYTGYTMTSDAPNFTPIDEGIYTVERRAYNGSGALPKNFQVFEGARINNIRTMDGAINQNAPTQIRGNGEGYKNDIFIHRTNNNGYAGGRVSTGCLLIHPQEIGGFTAQLDPLGNSLDNEPESRYFTLILERTGSQFDYSAGAPVEQLGPPIMTIFNTPAVNGGATNTNNTPSPENQTIMDDSEPTGVQDSRALRIELNQNPNTPLTIPRVNDN